MADLDLNPNAAVVYKRCQGRIGRLEQALKEDKPGPARKTALEKEISARKAKMASILKEAS